MTGITLAKQATLRLRSAAKSTVSELTLMEHIRKNTKPIAKAAHPYGSNFVLFAVIAITLAATQLAFYNKSVLGIYFDVATFALLLAIALYSAKARMLAISAAIIPITNVVGLCLPQSNFYISSIIYYSTLLLFALMYRFMFTLEEPVSISALRRRYFYGVPLMIFIGEILGLFGYVLLRRHYPFKGISLPLVFASVVVFAIAEEMYFRGLIQQLSSKLMHPVMSIGLTVICYTVSSIGHQNLWLNSLFALTAGTFLSITYYKKQNLVLTIALNSIMKLTYIGLVATFILK